MAKIKLQYKTAEMVNPSTKEVYADRRRPYVTGLRIYNIDELVRFSLDNNYIEGAKYELAKGIAKGLIEAERALLLAGNAVAIDGWVKYEPSLKGSVSADKRQLTKDNSLAVTIRALKELKMPLDTFSWQLADEGFKPTPDPDLELTGVHAPGIESPMIRVESSVWFDGTGLDGWTEGRDSIWCKNNRAEEAEFVRMDGDGSGAAVEFDGGMLKADEGAWSVLTDLGIVEGSEVRFKVTINGQSAEIVATVAEA